MPSWHASLMHPVPIGCSYHHLGETMAQLSGEERHAVKDCILRALNKLNDKDTQSTGVAELHEIFQARFSRGFAFCACWSKTRAR